MSIGYGMQKKKTIKDNRSTWLIDLIMRKRYIIGAEIGCYKGRTTARLLQFCPDLHLICVDIWGNSDKHTDYGRETYKGYKWGAIRKSFNRAMRAHRNRLTVYRQVSWEAAENVKDDSLDFVFIDADHGYEAVMKDIHAWYPKVRKGGIISGHDISIPSVKEAVSKCFSDWQEVGVDDIWYRQN